MLTFDLYTVIIYTYTYKYFRVHILPNRAGLAECCRDVVSRHDLDAAASHSGVTCAHSRTNGTI